MNFLQVKGIIKNLFLDSDTIIRGGFRAAATSKMERFVIIVNDWEPLTIIAKRSIMDVAAVLDPPLIMLLLTWEPHAPFCF